MATFTKFQPFVENLAEKVYNLGSDQLAIALTDAAHAPASTNGRLSQLTQISYANLSSRNVTTSSSAQTGGTYKLVCADLVLTASGSVGPFRYVVLYDDTAANDELIGYWDYGSEITLAAGETLTIDFDGTNGVLTIA
jgi:hypothetical protein